MSRDSRTMASHFQAAPLVASPSYPNSIVWSKENIVAIASGHLITILNPSSLMSPRGVITLLPNKPFPVGVVETEDLHATCLMPISLAHDVRPRARSISWSYPGFSPNSGCLLAVCTTGGRVKVYRPPFCEFCAEWVEVLDISDMLFDYLESINFGELELSTPQLNVDRITKRACVTPSCHPLSSKLHKLRKAKAISRRIEESYTGSPGEIQCGANSVHEDSLQDRDSDLVASVEYSIRRCSNESPKNQCSSKQDFSMKQSSQRSDRKSTGEKSEALPRISAGKYASQSAFLSSVLVAWSPVFRPSSKCPINSSSKNCAILAVGGKAGNISFWRFYEPECYTINDGRDSIDAMLIGLLQAHKSWISAISWELYDTNLSASQLILATGSCDGSVRIWSGDVQALMKSSEVTKVPFSLLKEVTAVTSVPVSVISLVLPVKSPDQIVLAVGKGSGAVEVWICSISGSKLQSAGVYNNAHDQVVTGLTWAFDGGCLYSCSQDNSVRSWVLNKSHLYEVPFPSNFSGTQLMYDRLQISDPCFGLAVSPGELMIAVVRSFDADLLNPMYQARRQKAAVEFFWIGGQLLAISSDKHLDGIEAFSGLSEKDLVCWESNILWSLMRCENVENLLVLWDALAALLAFKKMAPTFVENILVKWISSWITGVCQDGSIEEVLLHAQNMLPKISSRKMQLLNIICRRLVLIDLKVDIPDGRQNGSNKLDVDTEAQRNLWERLLVNCERELRERIMALTLKAALEHASSSASDFSIGTNWFSDVAQVERWISINSELVHDQLKLLALQIKEVRHRIQDSVGEESCSFCAASVPFESPEYAYCKGIACDDGFGRHHRLARCAVSMKLCSIGSPLWYCICCERWVAALAPQAFFTMSGSPLTEDCRSNASSMQQRSRPFCPFCGILLQRLLPDFLLSASPV